MKIIYYYFILLNIIDKVQTTIPKVAPAVNRWGRQSPGPAEPDPPPPLPPRPVSRQSSFSKIGNMFNTAISSSKRQLPSK